MDVETVVPEIAQSIGKNISFQVHTQAFEAMRKAGIFTTVSFIVGLPGETEEMRKSYVDLADKLADSAVFLPFQPLPGTPMETESLEPEDWCVEYAAKLTNEFRRIPDCAEAYFCCKGIDRQRNADKSKLAKKSGRKYS